MTKIFDKKERMDEEFENFIERFKSNQYALGAYRRYFAEIIRDTDIYDSYDVYWLFNEATYKDYMEVNTDNKRVVKFLRSFFEEYKSLYQDYEKGYWRNPYE